MKKKLSKKDAQESTKLAKIRKMLNYAELEAESIDQELDSIYEKAKLLAEQEKSVNRTK